MNSNRDRLRTAKVSVIRRVSSSWRNGDVHFRILLIFVVVVFVGLAIANPRIFLSNSNFQSMANQVSEIGLLTLGMSLTMLIGGIDLSITATANLSAILAGLSMQFLVGQGLPSGITSIIGTVICLAVGAMLGLFNGILIAYGRVIAILATMATLMLYGGIGAVLTGGITIFGFPDELLEIGHTTIWFLPVPLVFFIGASVVLWVFLNRTPFGMKMRLTGANARASAFAGIDNRRVIVTTHSMAGTLAALAGFVSLVKTDSANAQYGSAYILMTILIAVLGGVSIFGGKARIGGIVLALILFQFLGSGMNMLLAGVARGNFFEDIVWGLLLLGILSATMLFTARGPRGKVESAPLTEQLILNQIGESRQPTDKESRR